MGIETLVSDSSLVEIAKTFQNSEISEKLGEDFFRNDIEILEGLRETKTPELIDTITEQLVRKGRPGSAEFIDLFSKSKILDKEYLMLVSKQYHPELIENTGFPLMIDAEHTTSEMIEAGKVMLTPDTRENFLGSVNTLKYKLDQQFNKTALRASEYYANEMTRPQSLVERAQRAVGIQPKPYEIPFTPNDAEMARLEELGRRKYVNHEEKLQTVQRELLQIMKQRPASIDMGTTVDFSRNLGEISGELTVDMQGAIDIQRLQVLHMNMRGWSATELLIYPGYADAIESGVERDLTVPEIISESKEINN